jgi:hypothetical protein
MEALDAKMRPTNFTIGKTSELVNASACKSLPYEVSVNELATETHGTSGSRRNASGTSSSCVDFSSKSGLSSTLSGLQQDVATAAKDASRGSQGLDKDPSAQKCGAVAGAVCDPSQPTLTEGPDFQLMATVDCNIDFSTFNFDSVFGKANLNMDPTCKAKTPLYKILSTTDDETDGCSPVTMTIERYATDCCKQKTNTFQHILTIETLPPKFLTTAGSMDAELDCTANIHPEELGAPDYEPGCPEALQELEVSDAEPVFDSLTCRTTIERTFSVSDDGCAAKTQSFLQKITLTNDYDPEWDFFPPDTTIGVFDDYGTDAVGFPTVYQRCGASPVRITYEYADEIAEGECFAQRILTRTFTAVDVCGHKSERSQQIIIEQAASSLPLGDKSLAQIYGRSKANVLPREGKKPCLYPSDACNVFGAPDDYECGTADEEEFTQYQTELQSLSPSLNKGPIETSCDCPDGDTSCDERAIPNYLQGILYGVPLTKQAGACTIVGSMSEGANMGTVNTVSSIKCSTGGFLAPSDCNKKILNGTDQVYNIFWIEASDLKEHTIEIDAPSTSVVLVKVGNGRKSKSKQKLETVKVGKKTQGVILTREGMVANNILWNVEKGIELKVTPPSPGVYSWHGSLLNPLGDVNLTANKNFGIQWHGQMFADKIQTVGVDFQCGHFAGFASCSNTVKV